MTGEELESTDGEEGAAAGERRRGPGRRFAAGRSGNPAGRPRRNATGAPGDRLPGSDRPTRAMILEEAYGLITVGEGDDSIRIPANRAVFRALMKTALKGSQIAQRRWTEIVQQA